MLSHVPWTVWLLLRILGLPFSARWCSPLVVYKTTPGCDEMVSWTRVLADLSSNPGTWVKPQVWPTPAAMLGDGDRQTQELASQPAVSFKTKRQLVLQKPNWSMIKGDV